MDQPECGWEKPLRKWQVDPKFTTAAISLNGGSVQELVAAKPLVDISADFHLHEVKLQGTVIQGKLRSYLKLHQSIPWPGKDIDIVIVDRDDFFSIDFSSITCITVFSIAVASAQLCYHSNPNRVCGEVNVGIDLPWPIGHWGQTFTIACINL